MSQEITVNHLITAFDCVQNAFDMNAFIDFLKTNYKKEVVFLNAQDFAESNGRISKSESKTGLKTKHDGTSNIVRGLKSRIDADLAKIIETKKKTQAQIEKSKSGKVAKSKSRLSAVEVSSVFDGKIDVLYVILNYPYLPKQLNSLLEGGVDLNLFLAFVPKNGVSTVPFSKKSNEKSSRNQQKRVTIQGYEFDWSQNPNCYPPARWITLKRNVPPHVAFQEIHVEDEMDMTFKNVEEEILRIFRAKNEFNNFFQDKTLNSLPSCIPECSYDHFIEYMAERPGDFINAMYYELRKNNFSTTQPNPPPTILNQFNNLFDQGFKELERKVIFIEPQEINDIDFVSEIPPQLYPLLYKLLHWKIEVGKAETCSALATFLSSPASFYAYAGSKFDAIVASVNKKYRLGLPLSFFDWSQWNYALDTLTVGDSLVDAFHGVDIIETFFDDSIGILWILTLPPVSKNIGHYFTNYTMPQTIEGISEFIENIFENNRTETKMRSPPSPAQIVRENLDINILLPNLQQRMSSETSMYRLPMSISNSASFTTPYYLESGLKVDIIRNLESGKMTFAYNAYFKQLFEIYANSSAITIQPNEGIRIMIEDPFVVTLLFNEQSICYSPEQFVIKSTGELPIVLLTDGTFITQDRDQEMIVKPNGTISRHKDGKWTSCNAEGESFLHTETGLIKQDAKHSQISDIINRTVSMIRPDNTEYFVKHDGTRRILFNLVFSIEQQDNEQTIIYDIPNFPVINKNGNEFSTTLDRFDIKYSQKHVTVDCSDYTLDIVDGHVYITDKASSQANQNENNDSEKEESINQCTEMLLKHNHCEFKYQTQVILADANGTERFCALTQEVPAKKKIDIYETRWGTAIPVKDTLAEPQHVLLNKVFLPRFFAVRSDLTVTEFLCPNSIDFTAYTTVKSTISHPNSDELNVISLHNSIDPPIIYTIHDPLSKTERATIMKGFHLPKVKKTNRQKSQRNEGDEEEIISIAESSQQAFLYDHKIFVQTLGNFLERNHIQFEEENNPVEESPPEVLLIPPPTPSPYLLEMAANRYQQTVSKNASDINYWNSAEATFSFPLDEPKSLARPISPRVSLCDPPRFTNEKNREKDIPNYPISSPSSSPPMTPTSSVYIKSIHSRQSDRGQTPLSEVSLSTPVAPPSFPKTTSAPRTKQASIKLNPEIINFGQVKVNTSSIAQITLTNTGATPLHFSTTQPNNKLFKVLTIPGVVYPGLKVSVKVSLLPSEEPQYVSTSFELQTKFFQTRIPITVDIVE
ncbi:hypothetical protein TRFO_14701 [Tritrichomonas foetus]|uniref:MSP domain-containing protein n=1 Tax=Tritrichomonas foetus TaxID=1144522 RepID=A0A1J4KUW1_9EUKA|nr:hypothetical protein TRFO_14701 [Tritrichomonas foetus]|eukprot:OHT14906.1 hypothetical protein TRFO_14701 [Tritrichomonas foetus]